MKSNKKFFVLLVILAVLFGIFSLILRDKYDFATLEFSSSAGGFLIAIIFLFDAKNAKKPMKKWGPSNNLKSTLQFFNKLHLYKYVSYSVLAISSIWGIVSFILGMIKVLSA